MQTTIAGLSQCDLHDFFGDALDFDVHLQGSNTVFGTCHFEVHIAEMIFITQDIGQHGKLALVEDQTHRHACDVVLERDARIHHGERTTTYGRHRGRTV